MSELIQQERTELLKEMPLFPRLPPVQTSGTGYHAAVDSVCSIGTLNLDC
jgi:hypothetical protein